MSGYTKQLLEDTLLRLMKTESLNAITVKELVAECSMNRKTFYYHYDSIADLLFSIMERGLRQAVNHRTKPENWIEGAIGALTYIHNHKLLFQSALQSDYWPEIQLGLSRLLDECVKSDLDGALAKAAADGTLPPLTETDCQYILRFYSGALMALVEQWFAGGMRESVPEYISLLDNFLHDGMYTVFQRFSAKSSVSS